MAEVMEFPDVEEFSAVLGVEPSSFDQDGLTFWYSLESKGGRIRALVSFSALMRSFQVNFSLEGEEVAMVCAEGVERIRLVEEGDETKLCVSYMEGACSSEATLVVHPKLHLNWYVLTR